ncbi:MAG TPA: ABC transporter substrate-binding protein [Lapillicoccus sp.]|nr:ABC transporter substrate-binding protein [Lapillicoccus sp.]
MTSRFAFRPLVVVAAAAALGLAACSSGSSGGSSGGAGGGSGATGGAGGAPGLILVSSGKLTVCTHLPYAPFQSNDDTGKTIGFDVDMMDLVAKKIGVEQAIVDTPFEGIKSGQDLSTGKCDIAAAGMTITDERKKAILFSLPYFDATQALLVKSDSSVATLADLKGKKLGAQAATTGLDYANSKKAENGYEIVEFQDLATETQALTTGQVDAAINDLPVWTEAIKENKGATKVATQFDTGEQYGFGMKLGNDVLKKVVDDVITASKADGTYASLYTKWIGQAPPK